ncbi:ATP-dependent nuclease, partial [Limosilactobacillus mucosae]
MKFKNISIKNFRNFENINITLDNKNVFFGMNDVGKTNFLYALRFVFDRNIRKNNLIDSDFYQKNTDVPVEIIVSIDISDLNDVDSMKLRAKVKGALLSGQNVVYIKLIAKYDSTEMIANPILYWGGDLNDLEETKTRGVFSELDTVFNVIYIDAYVDLYNLFKKNSAILLKNDKNEDKDTLKHIDDTIVNLNKYISSLSGIKSFENRITPEYNHLKNDNIQVSVKSEIAVKGLYSNVVPYIKQDNDGELYPTSGEGRKKLLVYSIYDLLAEENTIRKINLFLIEEPENHLHRAMQIALSHKIFVDEKYKYTFLTTHSSFILSAMDKVNLIRIFNNTKVNSA